MEAGDESSETMQQQLSELLDLVRRQQVELKRYQAQLWQQQQLQEQMLYVQQRQHGAGNALGQESSLSGLTMRRRGSPSSSWPHPAGNSLRRTGSSSSLQSHTPCMSTPLCFPSKFQLPAFLSQRVFPFFSPPVGAAVPQLSAHAREEKKPFLDGDGVGQRKLSSASSSSLLSPAPSVCGRRMSHSVASKAATPPPGDRSPRNSPNSPSQLLLVLRCVGSAVRDESHELMGSENAVLLRLQQYLVNKLRGHPVLRMVSELEESSRESRKPFGARVASAFPLSRLLFPGSSSCDGSKRKFVVVTADTEKLLLVLEEVGGLKLTGDGVFFAPYRSACRAFFKGGRKDSRLFLTPNEAIELMRSELFAMRFGADAPYPSLQGLSVLEVCIAAGVVEDFLPLHQPRLLAVLQAKAPWWSGGFQNCFCRRRQTAAKGGASSPLCRPLAVTSAASYDVLVAAYFGYPAAAFSLFVRWLRRLLVFLLLLSLGERVLRWAVPSLWPLLTAAARESTPRPGASDAAAALSSGAGGASVRAASAAALTVAEVLLGVVDASRAVRGFIGIAVCLVLLSQLRRLSAIVSSVREEVNGWKAETVKCIREGKEGQGNVYGQARERDWRIMGGATALLSNVRDIPHGIAAGTVPVIRGLADGGIETRENADPVFSPRASSPFWSTTSATRLGLYICLHLVLVALCLTGLDFFLPPVPLDIPAVGMVLRPVLVQFPLLGWRSLPSYLSFSSCACPSRPMVDSGVDSVCLSSAFPSVSVALPYTGAAGSSGRFQGSIYVAQILCGLVENVPLLLLALFFLSVGRLVACWSSWMSRKLVGIRHPSSAPLGVETESSYERTDDGTDHSVRQPACRSLTPQFQASLHPFAFGPLYRRAFVLLLLLPLAAIHGVLLPFLVLSLVAILLLSIRADHEQLSSRRSFSGSGKSFADFLDLWVPILGSQLTLLLAAVASSTFFAVTLSHPHVAVRASGETGSVGGIGQINSLRVAGTERGAQGEEPFSGWSSQALQATILAVLLSFVSWAVPSTTSKLRLVLEMAERDLSAHEFGFAVQRNEAEEVTPLTCRVVGLPSVVGPASPPLPFVTRCLRCFFPSLLILSPPTTQRGARGGRIPPSLFEAAVLQKMTLTVFGLAAHAEIKEEEDAHGKTDEAVPHVNTRQLSAATDQYIASLPRGPGSTALTTVAPPSSAPETPLRERPEDIKKRVNQFLGEWLFNRSKSESMSPLTQHLGIPWVVRQAVEKFTPQLTYDYDEDKNELSVATTLTAGLTKTIHLNLSGLGVEQSDEDAGGAWKSSTRLEGSVLKTVQRNDGLNATLYETRRIVNDSGDPEDHTKDQLWYTAQLHKDNLAQDVIVNRYFDRVSGPPPMDETHLPSLPEEKVGGEQEHGTAGSVEKPGISTGGSTRSPATPGGGEGLADGEEDGNPFLQMGEQAVSAVKDLVDSALGPDPSAAGWSVSKGKGGSRIFQRDDEADRKLPVVGMGVITLNNAGISLETVIDYLKDPENKLQFDPQLLKAVNLDDLPCGARIVYHAFKGQWGFAGRDFTLLCYQKKISETRIILGLRSVDYPHAPAAADLWPSGAGTFVRATFLKGGYDLQFLSNGAIQISFVTQADLKADAVPTWINKRVKAEQLSIVASIKDHIEKRFG
ncbi:multi-pass transmembrane protein, related [Neospora caninum Liverpool]|uniref:Multi-pass transmembrane protein, related n=1 Tax=Neospora caninum (strain Liverpool) TaxID=572307 RepID=F0V8U9_NEOCL|nr:multi-pass transmembrane protein, related [Neospora caninum Liverpool]CBZ50140.1 multi-pass transmembrane protein, related [Neospora caninum Liverpool]|eukprot:XP_003880175.1 multi-pass transmembrane protein, related [Neospora caninum Liverpool]